MAAGDVKNFLARGMDIMGLELPDREAVIERLCLYFSELQKWNRRVNLVARTLDERQILENHFLDSLTLLPVFNRDCLESEALLDVGTGAGFPGLVLKTAIPSLAAVLIEPRRNRFYFLRHVARVLGFRDLELFNIRLEEGLEAAGLEDRKFTVITSRAFTDLNRFVRLTAPYLAPDGRIVCMKGPGAEKEISGLSGDGLLEEFRVAGTRRVRLPYSEAKRTLVMIVRSENSR